MEGTNNGTTGFSSWRVPEASGGLPSLLYSVSFSSLLSEAVPSVLCCLARVIATYIHVFFYFARGRGKFSVLLCLRRLGPLLELLCKCLHEMYFPGYSRRLSMNPALGLYENG